MVRVKRRGSWVTVSPGQSAGRTSIPTPTPTSTPKPTKTVSSDFIGPVRPGTIRSPKPTKTVSSDFIGPVRPGTIRSPKPTKTVSSDFIGPVRPGTIRSPEAKRTATRFKETIEQDPNIIRKTFKQSEARAGEIKTPFKERFKNIEDKNKIYSKDINAFVSRSEPSGQATAIITPPTISETKLLEEAEYSGSLERGIDLTKKGIKKYEEKIVIPLSEKKGTKKLGSGIKKTGDALKKAQEKYEKEVVVPLRKAIPTLGQTPVGQIAEAKRIIEKLPEDKDIIIGLPGQRKAVKAREFKGGLYDFSKKIYGGEVEKAFTDIAKRGGIKKPEIVGKVARGTSEFAPYLVPGVYAGEVGLRAGEAALGGKFGGPKNILQFAKENPLDVALVGAVGLVKGGKMIKDIGKPVKETSKFARQQIRLQEKYKNILKTPERKKVVLTAETKLKETQLKRWGRQTTKGIGKREQFIKKGEGAFARFGKKQKGTTRIKYQEPTGRYTGKTEEQFKRFWRKPKVLTGKATVSKEGKFIETLDIGKLKRVTTIKKTGIGKTEIFKKGKKVAGFPLKKQTFKDPLLESIKKSSKKKLEIGKDGIQEITKGKVPGAVNLNTKTQDLSKKFFRGESRAKVQLGKQKGVTQRIESYDDIADIMRISPKKKLEFVKEGRRSIKKIKEISPEITYAKGKPKTIWDETLYAKRGKQELLKKTISPTVGRKVARKTGQKITYTYGDDITREAARKKPKALLKKLSAKRKTKPIWDKETISKNRKELKLLKSEIKAQDKIDKITKTKYGKSTKGQKLVYKTKQKTKAIVEVVSPKRILPKIKFKTPRINILSKVKKPKISGITSLSKTGIAAGVKSISESIQKQNKSLSEVSTSRMNQATDQAQESIQKTKQKPDVTTRSISSSRQIPQTISRVSFKASSISRKIRRPSLGKPIQALESETKRLKKKKGVNLGLAKKKEFYMPEAKRNNKWVRLAKTGMLKNSALGRGARAVDNTVAGRFRIRPVEKGDPKLIDNYYAYNNKKFRDYKIVKGEKIPMTNKFIEKRGKGRIDTSGERKGLTLAKFMKQKGWAKKNTMQKKKLTKSKIPI